MTKSTKAAAAKAVNYTPEMESKIAAMYTGDNSQLSTIAAEIGKSVPSVRAKLSSMGVYRSEEKAKPESGRETKADAAALIGAKIGLNEAEEEALTKTTSAVLNKIIKALDIQE